MSDVEIRIERIEKTVNQILEIVSDKQPPSESQWLSEFQAMQLLNVSKRGLDEIRKRGDIRVSSATGRNFLFYKADLDKYIYDHVNKSKKSGNKSGGKTQLNGTNCNKLLR